jgi:hypothetical protein
MGGLRSSVAMRHEWRVLGVLFFLWALLQIARLTAVAAWGPPGMTWPTIAAQVGVTALYGAGGFVVYRRGREGRALAALLSAFSLLSYPLGTALGIYGLWVTLWRTRRPAVPR